MSEEIAAGGIELESPTDSIIIRIDENASVPSGRAKLRAGFNEVLDKIHLALAEVEGTVTVAGHTDDRPINTKRFRSNWELSAGRAVSVVHALLRSNLLDSRRFLIEGHGASRPLVDNDTPENRARNRRVEITLILRKVNGEILGIEGTGPEAETSAEPEEPALSGTDDTEKSTDTDSAAVESEQEGLPPSLPSLESGPLILDADVSLGEPVEGADSAPSGMEQDLPGVDALLPEYDGDLDTPAELEQLLRALDAAEGGIAPEEE